jgi:hypothetical protein
MSTRPSLSKRSRRTEFLGPQAAGVIVKPGLKPIALVGFTVSRRPIARIDVIAYPDSLSALVVADLNSGPRQERLREYALRGRRLIGECA